MTKILIVWLIYLLIFFCIFTFVNFILTCLGSCPPNEIILHDKINLVILIIFCFGLGALFVWSINYYRKR